MKQQVLSSFIGAVIMLCILWSCGNSGKPQVDEQALKDSIENALKDSLRNAESEKAKHDSIAEYKRIHSKQIVEKELKGFLSEYINDDDVDQNLSADFRREIKKWISDSSMGEFNLFGLNSSANIEKYNILSLTVPSDGHARAIVRLWIDNEGDYYEDQTTILLILENKKWVVDEINEVKKDMKSYMKEQGI